MEAEREGGEVEAVWWKRCGGTRGRVEVKVELW